ncbi:very-long-chain 3-oxoacyl-CoA reductase [Coleophoma cylindrospora]|uniref:Very-long-chain 3-oxoacyl-CoA reductase n=1 Tax=Coleophoma cylindrospora TaxID=1849047 RepID=A0A3D8Q9P2_9HELO|nr:very-long-chain 3-oxoacyl-CoA reductase [Coleophoma cylindrospora]
MDSLTNVLAHVPKAAVVSFAVIGFIFVADRFISYVRLLLSLFVLKGTNLRKYGKKGSWAIVTGASDGIGKEYAIQLAQKGFNIVLVSRTESKLQALAKEIEQKNYLGTPIQTKVLAMDFSKNDDGDYARLKALVDGLDVAILINNVGQSHSIPVPFVLTPKDEMKDIITINCIGTLKVTQIVCPGMVQRKRGLILTMGSFGGLTPTPLLATYSGSKAFLQQWSTALGGEVRSSGVDVELVISYLVTSAMSKIRKPSMLIPNPRNFVKSVLSKIGRVGGAQNIAYTSTPYWSHALVQWWWEQTIGTGSAWIIEKNKGMHQSIRTRALRKAEREAKKA